MADAAREHVEEVDQISRKWSGSQPAGVVAEVEPEPATVASTEGAAGEEGGEDVAVGEGGVLVDEDVVDSGDVEIGAETVEKREELVEEEEGSGDGEAGVVVNGVVDEAEEAGDEAAKEKQPSVEEEEAEKVEEEVPPEANRGVKRTADEEELEDVVEDELPAKKLKTAAETTEKRGRGRPAKAEEGDKKAAAKREPAQGTRRSTRSTKGKS